MSEVPLAPTTEGLVEWKRKLAITISCVTREETMPAIKNTIDKLIQRSKHSLILQSIFQSSSDQLMQNLPVILSKMIRLFPVDTHADNLKNWKLLIKKYFNDARVVKSFKSVLRTLRSDIIKGWVSLFIYRKTLCLDFLIDFNYFDTSNKFDWQKKFANREDDPTFRGIFGMRTYEAR